ncbi:peptidylprolyl isomerase [Janibacter sp. Soil728]|uniref:peptidylprolyl isomerase n=1 Tax=Janibacter sp. Soil728 TaxID=1736393 RepID=UPI0006FFECE2|nr:peptidylprolyl isomerase [Janibacter sp. Soil728]KRE38925.1 peptidylprolyl isomerase [Janibacter sp. Soil728]
MIRRALPAIAAASLLALTGCGTDSGGSPESSSAASPSTTTISGKTECPPEGGAKVRVTAFEQAPPMCIDPKKTYTAKIATDEGDVTVKLDAEKAPKTVNNFVVLARYKYYDGLTFHRVIQDFMAQGGDPVGDGSGGPGYQFEDELPQAGEYKVGSIAMANAGPDTNGSQFFIITGDAGVGLPPSYTLFGQVTQGMETVTAIEDDGSMGDGPPREIHTIKSVTITEK